MKVWSLFAGVLSVVMLANVASAQFQVRVKNIAAAPAGPDEIASTEAALADPTIPVTATASPDVINFPDNGFPAGTTEDNFVLEATGLLVVPAAGTYRFGVNSDDGFRLTISGATIGNTTNENGTGEPGDVTDLEYNDPRGPADTDGDFTFAAPGQYPLRLVFYEAGGGEQVRLSQVLNGGARVDLGNTGAGALDVIPVPEPASLGLLGLVTVGLLARRRRTAQ